ncbi:Mur ligase family protein [Allochromatium palmeri]|uniref:ATP-grasp domain-containing protein n=1 Tax=Allochromatium palmeri TaxID=231048 RepID=A0A6N8EGM4_9GAMM|nr:Mur ligase family protein [Allochromatium palmeri]MTW22771.1 hypothetical protein [Allochromatium palmeri]
MQITKFQFLRSPNLIAPTSGSLISLGCGDFSQRFKGRVLLRWLTCLPTTLALSEADLEGPTTAVLPRLLFALSEHARINDDPIRVLHKSSTALRLWLPSDDQKAAEAAAALTCHILLEIQRGNPPSVSTARLWASLHSRFWNQTHAHLARAAQQLDILFTRLDLDGRQFLQLGQGCRLRLCSETLTDRTPLFARMGTDKAALHHLMQHRGVPLPTQEVVESLEQALAAAERIGWPMVLKLASGGKGRGVWVGLSDPEGLRQAWHSQAQGVQARQLVQQTLVGDDHRFLVIQGELMAVAQRQPAFLVSDGRRPLGDQIAALNADPLRGLGYERLKNRVPVDTRLHQLLAKQGFSVDSVPAEGTQIQLSRTANISQGGSAVDCSDRVHPDNRRLAEDIARLIGGDVIGLDLISRNIGVSWRRGGTWLLEANLSPGLRPHLVANPQSDLCQRILRRLMGDSPRAGRIPTALITGSLGKTTASRMLAHLLQSAGLRVGLTSSTGMELDGQVILKGDCAGGKAALHLLQDRRVEAMVAEIARGGLIKGGLGIARADVSAVLNIHDNHVGMDGIRSRADLARIKAVVAKAAERLLVLNADDPLVLAMARHRNPASVALVSEEPGCAAWHAHRRAGHLAVSYGKGREGKVTLHRQGQPLLSMPLREIPAADDGTIATIAIAAAFATAMAHGLGLNSTQTLKGLRDYGLQASHRNGRFEILMREPWHLVLCWADGPDAMASISNYAIAATETAPQRRVLLCSVPDTRPDDYVREVGRATWGFHLVICAAWFERDGRTPDEVPALLEEGVRSLGSGRPTALLAGEESAAVLLLAQQLRPGDFCVVCSFDTYNMRERLLAALR